MIQRYNNYFSHCASKCTAYGFYFLQGQFDDMPMYGLRGKPSLIGGKMLVEI